MNKNDLLIKLNEMLAKTKCSECGSPTELVRAIVGARIGDMFFGCETGQHPEGGWVPDNLQKTAHQKYLNYKQSIGKQLKRERLYNNLLNRPPKFSEKFREVTSQSTRENFQTRYYQSAAMPEEFVDAIHRLDASEETVSSFAHWRLEFPDTVRRPDELIQPVISVCETLLHRGAVAFSTPGVQKLATEKLSSQIADTDFFIRPRVFAINSIGR